MQLHGNSLLADQGKSVTADVSAAGDSRVTRRECASCGYEPRDQDEGPRRACPKCLSWAWATVVRSAELRASDHRWLQQPRAFVRPTMRCVLSPSR